eukprot:2711780-Pleurochrysis_carterae.AAC.3
MSKARVTHRALPPLTARELGDMPVFASCSALFVVATRKGAAQASNARSGDVRASRSAARSTEGRGTCLEEGAPSGRESPDIRSPETWTMKRMGQTHATHRSRTTGATGARTIEAATTGRHAALYAGERIDVESGQDAGKSQLWARPRHPQLLKKLS